MKKSDLKDLKLTFTYCECGCHGHLANTGQFRPFWIFQRISVIDKKIIDVHLYRGHGSLNLGTLKLGEYKTFKQAVNKANDIMRTEVRKLLESLGG